MIGEKIGDIRVRLQLVCVRLLGTLEWCCYISENSSLL